MSFSPKVVNVQWLTLWELTQPPQEVGQVVGQREQLQAGLVVLERPAGKLRPLHGVAFLDPLLRRAVAVVEAVSVQDGFFNLDDIGTVEIKQSELETGLLEPGRSSLYANRRVHRHGAIAEAVHYFLLLRRSDRLFLPVAIS
jgi:hypothetical protein